MLHSWGGPGVEGGMGDREVSCMQPKQNPKCDRCRLDSTGFEIRGALFDAVVEVCGETVSRTVKCFVLACLFIDDSSSCFKFIPHLDWVQVHWKYFGPAPLYSFLASYLNL